jgi:hypothetical protein
VTGGACTLVAIAHWAHDADREALARFGMVADIKLPCESTVRRSLAAGLDADDQDARKAAWLGKSMSIRRVANRLYSRAETFDLQTSSVVEPVGSHCVRLRQRWRQSSSGR